MSYEGFSLGRLTNLGGVLGPLFGASYPQVAPRTNLELASTRLSLRVIPIEGRSEPATPFIVMMDELEERFLAAHCGSHVAVRTIEVSIFTCKRQMLEETLERHGYRILDEIRL